MNKYETAIAEIQERAVHTLKTVISSQTAEVAVEALEKQMPKRVQGYDRILLLGLCPTCGTLSHQKDCKNYCVYCGQRLEW